MESHIRANVATQSKCSRLSVAHTGLIQVPDVDLDGSVVLCRDQLVRPGTANTNLECGTIFYPLSTMV